MRTVFLFLLMAGNFCSYCQTGCKPTANIKVVICSGLSRGDSICPVCKDCRSYLKAVDSNYAILSFTFTVSGEGFNNSIEVAPVTGPQFSDRAKLLMSMLRSGSYYTLECIKARHKNGSVFTLQPIYQEIK